MFSYIHNTYSGKVKKYGRDLEGFNEIFRLFTDRWSDSAPTPWEIGSRVNSGLFVSENPLV